MRTLLYILLAAGANLLDSTAETVLSSFELAPNTLQVGKVIHARGSVVVEGVTSTPTFTVRFRVGNTTLTGTAVASGTGTAAAGSIVHYDLRGVVRSIDADGKVTIAWEGTMSAVGAAATATPRVAYSLITSTTLDTDLGVKLEVTGQWGTQSASNIAAAQTMTVEEQT